MDKSKKVVVNPLYPPSTPSITTTPSTVNISSNSCTPSNTLDDFSLDTSMCAPTGAIGSNIMGGQTTGSEMLDSCDFERDSEEYDESEIDERSL